MNQHYHENYFYLEIIDYFEVNYSSCFSLDYYYCHSCCSYCSWDYLLLYCDRKRYLKKHEMNENGDSLAAKMIYCCCCCWFYCFLLIILMRQSVSEMHFQNLAQSDLLFMCLISTLPLLISLDNYYQPTKMLQLLPLLILVFSYCLLYQQLLKVRYPLCR